MKKYSLIFVALIVSSCVQKTRTVTVEYHLHVSKLKNIKSVAIRGGDKPLSWESDFAMQPIKPDSLYKCYVTYKTGYKFTEVKFVVDDTFELANSPNRKIVFSARDTTVYKASYNR